MSVENLITNLFNIELDKIQKIDSVVQSDGSITVYIQLKAERKNVSFVVARWKYMGIQKGSLLILLLPTENAPLSIISDDTSVRTAISPSKKSIHLPTLPRIWP